MKTTVKVCFVLVSSLLLAACGGVAEPGNGETSPPAAVDGGAKARTLPIPGGELPPNHPPTGGLVWELPAGWIEEPPASSMRRAQFRVPTSAGEAECVVFYFGPGQGGDPMANANRWAGQFVQPDGSSSLDKMQVQRLDSANLETVIVEVTGEYNGGMTMTAEPAESKPGWMLLGGIVKGPDAPWFFKFTGPEEALRAERESFSKLLRSVRAGS